MLLDHSVDAGRRGVDDLCDQRFLVGATRTQSEDLVVVGDLERE
jgi:hypothetical protein